MRARQALLQDGALGRRVASRDPLPGALQEPVDHLDRGRTVAQHGERVDQALDPVVTLDQPLEVVVRGDASLL